MLDKIGLILWNFDSLSTSKYRSHLLSLGQFQNEIILLEFLLKKFLKLLDMVIEFSWYIYEGIWQKYSFGSWNSISNNNNMLNLLYLRYLTNITPHGKKFFFSGCDIHHILDGFLDNFIFSPNMQNQCSDIVFNTCIRNNKYDIIALGWILEDILKFIMMSSSCFGIFTIYCVKEKAIRKIVY